MNHVDLPRLSHQLLSSARLYSWAELQGNPALPPATGGVYSWFFASIPPSVPTDGCVRRDGKLLLYVGIAPKSGASAETLRSRLRYHYRGNAEGSTLRLTLGCLLESKIGSVLRRVGSGTRMTFGPAEERLTEWMAKHAMVGWIEIAEPWLLEDYVLATTSLPLNLDKNNRHPFRAWLSNLRAKARDHARSLPILKTG